MSDYHYVVEDAAGNTREFSFNLDGTPGSAVEIIHDLRDVPGAKLHIYRRVVTICQAKD